jgi:sulfoxide reductase catalytic subunit YedY
MRTNKGPFIPPSDITPESVWLGRRRWLQRAALGSLALGAAGLARADDDAPVGPVLDAPMDARWSTPEKPNGWRDITTDNKFYEFGSGKGYPAANAGRVAL